jgi:hypothetical protein
MESSDGNGTAKASGSEEYQESCGSGQAETHHLPFAKSDTHGAGQAGIQRGKAQATRMIVIGTLYIAMVEDLPVPQK